MTRFSSAIPLMLSLVLAACADADRTGTSSHPASGGAVASAGDACGEDCFSILRTGVEWLIEETALPPSRIVLDTVRTGIDFRGGLPGTRLVSIDALGRLAAYTGLDRGDEATIIDCSGRDPGVPSRDQPCRLRRGDIIVQLYPPERAADGIDASLFLRHHGRREARVWNGEAGRYVPVPRWVGHGYQLQLRKDADDSWRVVDARLIERAS